jgi:hypothetical protein
MQHEFYTVGYAVQTLLINAMSVMIVVLYDNSIQRNQWSEMSLGLQMSNRRRPIQIPKN